jgi:DNA-binding NarL/FixJ family response regulator
MKPRRVLLADDAPEMLEKISWLLRDNFEIVGRAQDGKAALDAAEALDLNIDLVILDISMPLLNGIQVASKLRERGCKAKVIFVTVHQDVDYIEAAFSVGASGYVLKFRVATDLIPTVEAALQANLFTPILT